MPPMDDLASLEPAQPLEPIGATDDNDASEAIEVKPRSPSRNGKSKSKRSTTSLPSLILPLITCVGIAGLAFGGYKFFDAARTHVGEQDRFRVAARDIEVTPLPVWIRTDLLAEVQRLADLPDNLNTLDADLAKNPFPGFIPGTRGPGAWGVSALMTCTRTTTVIPPG